jgi:hypothetical protein
MNKILSKIAIVAFLVALVSFFVSGIIGAQTGLFKRLGAGNIFQLDIGEPYPIIETRSISLDGAQTIAIGADAEDIQVQQGDAPTISAQISGKFIGATPQEKPILKIEKHGTILSIVINHALYSDGIFALRVTIPKQYQGALIARGTSSDIDIASGKYKTVWLETDSGDIKGNTTISQMQSLNAKSKSGDVTLHISNDAEKSHAKKIDIETASGDIKLTAENIADSVKVKSDSGDIELELPDDPFKIDASTQSGDLLWKFSGKQSILTEKSEEHIIVNNKNSQRQTINATSGSGDIKISRI